MPACVYLKSHLFVTFLVSIGGVSVLVVDSIESHLLLLQTEKSYSYSLCWWNDRFGHLILGILGGESEGSFVV